MSLKSDLIRSGWDLLAETDRHAVFQDLRDGRVVTVPQAETELPKMLVYAVLFAPRDELALRDEYRIRQKAARDLKRRQVGMCVTYMLICIAVCLDLTREPRMGWPLALLLSAVAYGLLVWAVFKAPGRIWKALSNHRRREAIQCLEEMERKALEAGKPRRHAAV